MTIYRVVLSGSTSGGNHPIEFSGSTISEPKHLIYLLPITTTTTTINPDCVLICTINCNDTVDCTNSGGTAQTITSTTTTTIVDITTTTTTTIIGYSYNQSNYVCGTCEYSGQGSITNIEPLTVGKYYYYPEITRTILITSYSGYIGPVFSYILDSNKQDSCAVVNCGLCTFNGGVIIDIPCSFNGGEITDIPCSFNGGEIVDTPTTTTTTLAPTTTTTTLAPTTTTTTLAPTTTTTTLAPTTTTTTLAPTTTTTTTTTLSPTTTTTTTEAPIVSVYGRLYNYFAISGTGVNSISNTGWHVPTFNEFISLITYLGGYSTAGGTLKETGLTHWITPNTGADNSSGFLGLPAGYRLPDGTFGINNQQYILTLWSSDTYFDGANYYNGMSIISNSAGAFHRTMNYPVDKNKQGSSLRLIKDDSSWTIGDKYTGNDGQQYDTVKIGTQVWTFQNLKETYYQNGISIPEVMNDATWGALSTGARCYYII